MIDAVRFDHAGKDAQGDQQDQHYRNADAPSQGSHRSVGGALVDHHVVKTGAQVPDDRDQESDDQQFLHGEVPTAGDALIIRLDRALVVRARVGLLLLALAMIAGFISLGRWQLQRAGEKQQMLAELADAIGDKKARPVALAAAATADGYTWAAGRGHFRASPILLLDNQRRGARVGVHVFGVFVPERGEPLLVDLGWLPLPGDRRLPDVSLPQGEQDVAGLLAPPPSPGIALGPAYTVTDARRWLLTRIDIAALAEGLQFGLAPRILRLDPALPIGFARDLDVLPNTLPPERHRGYAVQWFGLAIATFFIAVFLGFRRRPK